VRLDGLSTALRGHVVRDVATLEAYARDFSLAVRRLPTAVVAAKGSDDVRATLQFASAHGLPVTLRAGGNSGHGQALGEGLVLLAPRPATAVTWRDETLVEVSAGARWRDVEIELRSRGRTAPVLPAYLDATVGGTLAVGGYGVRSISRGNQLDHVTDSRLIRMDGSSVWCSSEMHADLFSYGLGSLGQLGVLDRVVMRTTPFRRSRLFRREFTTFRELAHWLKERPATDGFFAFAGRADYLRGVIAAHLVLTDGAAAEPPTDATLVAARRDIDMALDADVRTWLRLFPEHARLFTDLIFDHPGLVAFAQWLDEIASEAEDLQGVYLLAARNGAGFPFDGRFGETQTLYGMGLYMVVPRSNRNRRAAAESRLAEALARCLASGGRPFLWGWQRLSEQLLRETYGAAYTVLQTLRTHVDPHGLLNPGAFTGPGRSP
jgi:FAD/FMN-containing dehydrogenase